MNHVKLFPKILLMFFKMDLNRLTEHCDDELAYFQAVVFGTIQMQSHAALDFLPNLVIGVAACYLLSTL